VYNNFWWFAGAAKLGDVEVAAAGRAVNFLTASAMESVHVHKFRLEPVRLA